MHAERVAFLGNDQRPLVSSQSIRRADEPMLDWLRRNRDAMQSDLLEELAMGSLGQPARSMCLAQAHRTLCEVIDGAGPLV